MFVVCGQQHEGQIRAQPAPLQRLKLCLAQILPEDIKKCSRHLDKDAKDCFILLHS